MNSLIRIGSILAILSFGLLIGVTVATLPISRTLAKKSLDSLQVYSRLEVGKSLPSWAGQCDDKSLGSTTPAARFHVHIVGNKGTPCCVDLGCTNEAHLVVKLGGSLQISSDLKLAKNLGIPIVHDGNDWAAAESLMLIADSSGKILGIFRNANASDLAKALFVTGLRVN